MVVLRGSRRERAVRIPNGALAFRPAPDVLKALSEGQPHLPDTATHEHEGDRTLGEVWQFNGHQFTPIVVRPGLADDGWTELVSGSIHPGDALVTSAVLHRRSRMQGTP